VSLILTLVYRCRKKKRRRYFDRCCHHDTKAKRHVDGEMRYVAYWRRKYVWGKTSVRISGCNLNHLTNERKENRKTQEEKGRRQVKVIVGPAGHWQEQGKVERQLVHHGCHRPTPSRSSLRAITSIVPSTSP
jgi:hypothetical protein